MFNPLIPQLYIYFQVLIHGFINSESIIIDGETLRAKLQSKETLHTVNKLMGIDISETHLAPELMLREIDEPNIQTDIWSTTALLLEFLLDQKLWDFIGKWFLNFW